MAYAKYARGYRQGGIDPSIIGLERWQPETVDTYELGTKTSFAGVVRGYFNFAAFYDDFRDQQLAVVGPGRTGTGITAARVIVNAGQSRLWGIEADASVTPFDDLKLDVGYAYLNTTLQAFTPPDLSGSPYDTPAAPPLGGDLPLSPHHRLTATATYRLPLKESIGRVSLGATYVYTSEQLTAVDVNPFARLPSSKLLNLNLNWESIRALPIDLSVFATNVTQEQFPVNIGNNWSSTGYESFVTNTPRMWGMRLRYRFGE
jgi:iron complex outermembrane receptor protein